MNANERESKMIDDAFPFDLWSLEVDWQSELQIGSLQVVDALREVLTGEAFNALQLDDDLVLHQDIAYVLADTLALVCDREPRL